MLAGQIQRDLQRLLEASLSTLMPSNRGRSSPAFDRMRERWERGEGNGVARASLPTLAIYRSPLSRIFRSWCRFDLPDL